MPVKRLTEEGIARLKAPPGKQVDYRDAVLPGLTLRVNFGGKKTWRAAYRKDGKPDKDGKPGKTYETAKPLGRWPIMGLKEAREAARAFLIDPGKAVDDGTFAEVMDLYLERHVRAQALRSAPEIERSLRVYVLPHWAHRSFASIKRADVTKLLDHIEDQRGKRTADLTLGYIRSMTNFYAKRNDDYTSPIIRGMGRNNGDTRRERILADDEIAALWQVEGAYADLCRFLLLTGQRRRKAETLELKHVVDGAWTIETTKREKPNAGVLPLPQMALDLIHKQLPIRGKPVFGGAGHRDSYKADLDRKLAAALGRPLEPFVIHDLRRTCRSLLSRIGIRPDVAERVLGHRVGSAVAQTYDRWQYAPEMGKALEALAAEVARILGVAVPQQATRAASKAAGAPGRRRLGG
jgi:integrase